MSWTAPTYKSALEATGLALEPNAAAKCPCCGRRTNADMLTDLRSVATEQREAWGIAGIFCCDACRELAFARGVSRVDFYAALGAPQEVLERIP